MSSRQGTWRQGLGLTLCAFVAKAIGALYRLPLTNLLGAKGMGGYQLVFPVYAFVLALTSSAIPLLLARQIAKDERFGYAVFRAGLSLMAFVGTLGGALLLCWAYPLACWQGWAGMAYGYALLAPAVLAVALMAPFRGWFQANRHWGALAGVNLCEQVLKLAGLGMAFLMRARGQESMIVAAIGGVTFAEVATLALCLGAYRVLGYRLSSSPVRVDAAPLWYSALPITAANLVMPTVHFVNSVLLVKLCVWSGRSAGEAVGLYGIWTGAVGTLLALPVVLSMAFAALVVPAISRAAHGHDWRRIRRGSADTLFVVVALCLPCAVGLALLDRDVVAWLYPKLSAPEQAAAVRLLRVGCIGIPLVCLQQLYSVLLLTIERSRTVALQTGVGALAQVGLSVALVPTMGMMGAAIASVGGSALTVIWHAVTYRRLTGHYRLARPFLKCLLAGLGMAGVIWSLLQLGRDWPLYVVWIVLLGGAVYAILLWALGGIRWLHRAREENA